MLDEIVRRLVIAVFAGRVPGVDAARWFWDLKYLYHFGLPKLPPLLPMPWPPGPQPDPDPASLAQRVSALEQLVFELIDVGRDPSPQPSQSVLLNREIRLESVKRMTKQFETGLQQLAEEQKRLTTTRA